MIKKHDVVDSDGNYNFTVREVIKDLDLIFHGTNTLEVLNEIRDEAVEKKGYGNIDEAYSIFYTKAWISNSKAKSLIFSKFQQCY